MAEELEAVLRLVAEGRLTPAEAAPIIEALTGAERGGGAGRGGQASAFAEGIRSRIADEIAGMRDRGGTEPGRQLRIRVTERGRQVVNLRIPIGFVDSALEFVPGLAGDQSRRIRDAVLSGETGPILDIEEADGSGVLISVE